MSEPRILSVIGGSRATEKEQELAEEVGRLIGRGGHILLCGGRGGVMEAVCRGAVAEMGTTVGLLPGRDRHGANPYVTIAIPTGLGELRNLAVAQGGQAVIAVGGSYGTLSEIAFALKAGRPVIGLGTWAGSDGQGNVLGVRPAETPAQAVRWALEEVEERESG